MKTIYVYSQNVQGLAGQVCDDEGLIERYEQGETDDIRPFHSGTEEEIIAYAIERLGKRLDRRPGGNLDSYDWKCCRNVLEYLGGPEVTFDEQEMVYVVVSQDDEEK